MTWESLPRETRPRVTVRASGPADVDAVSAIWRAGWHEVHDGHVPDALARARSDESFTARAKALAVCTTVVTVDRVVAGFVIVVMDEVQHLYVDQRHRGHGVADLLLNDAEWQISVRHASAWLAVVAPNARARHFYERKGWTDEGPFDHLVATPDGPVVVPVRRYVKLLRARATSQHITTQGEDRP